MYVYVYVLLYVSSKSCVLLFFPQGFFFSFLFVFDGSVLTDFNCYVVKRGFRDLGYQSHPHSKFLELITVFFLVVSLIIKT